MSVMPSSLDRWIAGSLDRSGWDRGRCGREMDMDGALSVSLSVIYVRPHSRGISRGPSWMVTKIECYFTLRLL